MEPKDLIELLIRICDAEGFENINIKQLRTVLKNYDRPASMSEEDYALRETMGIFTSRVNNAQR